MKIDSILEAIGKTPSVRLPKLFSNPSTPVYGKCEFLNPGGSLKDRIAHSMIKQAEAEGKIKPGDTLIEATAGNTGIGLALAGAVLGYRVIITMSGRMSIQKQKALEAYGAKVYRTPIGLAFDHPDSHFSLAKKLSKTLPNAYLLDQFSNPANPKIHEDATAEEIWEDFGPNLDVIFVGLGTGGTLSGLSRRLREKNPSIRLIGVEPVGSLFAQEVLGSYQGEKKPYQLEGIGQDFIPKVFNPAGVDHLIQVRDEDAFEWSRKLALQEGLWVGGSSGAVAFACHQFLVSSVFNPHPNKSSTSLLILPDTGRNYG
jgi:cysteine synthase A